MSGPNGKSCCSFSAPTNPTWCSSCRYLSAIKRREGEKKKKRKGGLHHPAGELRNSSSPKFSSTHVNNPGKAAWVGEDRDQKWGGEPKGKGGKEEKTPTSGVGSVSSECGNTGAISGPGRLRIKWREGERKGG